MIDGYILLVIIEAFIIILGICIKVFFNHRENKKINNILGYFDKRAKDKDEEFKKKFDECLDIIKRNS